MDYERDLYIDETALDIEWLGQASLMIKYTTHQASENREVNRCKEKLDVIKAQLDKDIRSHPSKYGLKSITEMAVLQTTIIHKTHKEAISDLIDARYRAEMAQGAVRALEQRKQALENLSRLLGLQYFAGPRTPRDLTTESARKGRQERVNSNIKITRKRKNNGKEKEK